MKTHLRLYFTCDSGPGEAFVLCSIANLVLPFEETGEFKRPET